MNTIQDLFTGGGAATGTPSQGPVAQPAPVFHAPPPHTFPNADQNLINDSDIEYYMTGGGGVPPIEVPNRAQFQAQLDHEFGWWTSAEMNDKLVSPGDFFYRTFRWGIAGLQTIVKHKGTGSTTMPDTVLAERNAYPLVESMIDKLSVTAGGR